MCYLGSTGYGSNGSQESATPLRSALEGKQPFLQTNYASSKWSELPFVGQSSNVIPN